MQSFIGQAFRASRSRLQRLPAHCVLITVVDGHPATLSWLGSVAARRMVPLGVEHFGQSGSIADFYRHFEIDANAIVAAASWIVLGRPVRLLGMGR